VLEAPWKNLILKVVDVKQEEEEAMREVLDQAADVLAGARLVQVGLERLQQKFRTSR
jgi:peptide subunit release factor 1 (eRF1)